MHVSNMNVTDKDPQYVQQSISVAIAFLVLSIIFVVSRFTAREIFKKTPWNWDDYMIIPALLLNVALQINGICMCYVEI